MQNVNRLQNGDLRDLLNYIKNHISTNYEETQQPISRDKDFKMKTQQIEILYASIFIYYLVFSPRLHC
jgi:hypothetical protein